MKKGFTIIELVSLLTILAIIGLVVTKIVISIVKDINIEGDKISVNNYANKIMYNVELYKKNNGDFPKWCKIKDNKIFYDENNNNKKEKDELLCKADCEDDKCIKHFITADNISKGNKDIVCNEITIDDSGNVKVSDCTIDNNKLEDYSYKISIKN